MKRKTIQKKCVRVFLLLMVGMLTLSSNSFAQSGAIAIKGVVKDIKGEPVIGASVVQKGTTNGTITDVDGLFELSVPSDGVLAVSFIGFKAKDIPVAGKSSFNITLDEDNALLDEVVVIGYGGVKKSDLTGSVTTLSANTLAKGLATTPTDLIIGRAPGVSVINDGGAPGSGATIRIRGGSSLSASNDPLIVIDGVPVDNVGINGMANPLAAINPNDIESFTVLKDASATAIYGSRASNGVIIVTTKKGQSGKPQITYNATFGLSTKKGQIDVMNADTFRNFVTGLFGTNSPQGKALGTESTNWQDLIFKTAFSTDHNIGVGGMAGRLPYRVSVGYTNEDGILKTSNMERWTGAVNLTPKFFDDMLSLQVNVKGVYNKNRFADKGAIGSAADFDPTQPVYAADGVNYGNGYFMFLGSDGKPLPLAPANPLAFLNQKEDISRVNRGIGNIQADYKMHFFPDLKATLNMGFDVSQSNGSVTIQDNSPMTYTQGKFKGGWGENSEYTQLKRNQVLDFYLTYTKEIEKHSLSLMGGYSWQHFYRSETNLYPNSNARRESTGNEFWQDGNFPRTENYLVSFYGRANYSYASRYLFTFTLRKDGSSRFGEDNRWGLFPAGALAWKINEESFMKDQHLMSDLKLRIGYGVTGQQDLPKELGDYPYMSRYTFSQPGANYYFGDKRIQLLRPEAYNSKLKWEETTTYNVGLDYGFLNNRISGTVDLYYRKSNDLLNVVRIPGGANFSNELLTNFGDLTNRGVEFAITGRPIVSKDLNWSLSYNIAYNKNEITRLSSGNTRGSERGGISGGTGSTILIDAVGHSRGSFFVYEQIYDSAGNPIEGAFKDQNGDGKIDSSDKIIYKSGDPKVVMGLTSQLSYKQWDFNFMMHANIGNYAYNNIQSNREAHGESIMFDPSGFLKNRMNSASTTNFDQPQYLSSFYVQNASFLRMDNISVGYTFNKVFKYISSARVFTTVQNPFVITSYKGLDPEFNNDAIDNNIYPRPRMYLLGFNLNF